MLAYPRLRITDANQIIVAYLSGVLYSPSFDEGHLDGAHLGQAHDGVEPGGGRLRKQLIEVLLTEDLC